MADIQHNKIALVTGANRGIGYSVARQLGVEGITVYVAARSASNAQKAVGSLQKDVPTGKFIPLQLDVRNEADIAGLDSIYQEHGHLDILINNAGVYLDDPRKAMYRNMLDLSPDLLNQTMETNLYGPQKLIWKVLPWMKKVGFGRIINVSSGMGRLADLDGNGPFYRLSKAALNALTIIVAKETQGYDIQVNAACPGWVKTEMGGDTAPRSSDKGAETIVWLALQKEGSPSGFFFRDKSVLDWTSKAVS